MKRRGQYALAQKTIYWMLGGIIITALVFSFALTISSYKNNLTKVPSELQAELIALRFANLPECFAYEDSESGIVPFGIIDLSTFTNEHFTSCYQTSSSVSGLKQYNFRLRLEYAGKEIKTNNYFFNDEFSITREVLVHDNGNLEKDLLIIYVQEKR